MGKRTKNASFPAVRILAAPEPKISKKCNIQKYLYTYFANITICMSTASIFFEKI
jgi:hypothetical protein